MAKCILFLMILLSAISYSQTCPSTIRVGSSCGGTTSCSPCTNGSCCHNCTGTVDVVAFDTYVKRVLVQEWMNCWGSLTNGMNSLEAGAVAARSYSINRIASLANCHGVNYDICNNTCCQVYLTTQYTNSNNAVDQTADQVLVSGGTVMLAEFASEGNNGTCGNGYTGEPSNGWPCQLDQPCTGKSHNGHSRGMCQWGSARWATGDVLSTSGCSLLSSHGYGTKTWQQILAHYYPNWSVVTCSAAASLTNDDCPGTTLSVGTSCNPTSGTVVGATSSGTPKASCDAYSGTAHLQDVWYKFVASSTGTYNILAAPSSSSTSNTNIDIVLSVYGGSCGSLTEVGCADNGGGPGVSESLSLALSAGTYYVRIYDSGNVAPTTGDFSICVYSSCSTPSQPSSSSGTNIQQTSFTANWGSVSGATSYYLDVSTSPSFSSFISGYNNLNVGNTTSFNVSSLTCNTDYYYRLRAANSCATSSNSGSINVTTSACTCTYSLSSNGQQYSASGGSGSFQVVTQAGCYWNVYNSGCSFVSFSPNNGYGTTTINYTVAANGTANPRTCTITNQQSLNQYWKKR